MWRGLLLCLPLLLPACGLGAAPQCEPIERSFRLCDQNAIFECPVETPERGQERREAIARCNRMELAGQIGCLGNLKTPKVDTVLVEECGDKTCVETRSSTATQVNCR